MQEPTLECELRTREDRPELSEEDVRAWFLAEQAVFLERHLLCACDRDAR